MARSPLMAGTALAVCLALSACGGGADSEALEKWMTAAQATAKQAAGADITWSGIDGAEVAGLSITIEGGVIKADSVTFDGATFDEAGSMTAVETLTLSGFQVDPPGDDVGFSAESLVLSEINPAVALVMNGEQLAPAEGFNPGNLFSPAGMPASISATGLSLNVKDGGQDVAVSIGSLTVDPEGDNASGTLELSAEEISVSGPADQQLQTVAADMLEDGKLVLNGAVSANAAWDKGDQTFGLSEVSITLDDLLALKGSLALSKVDSEQMFQGLAMGSPMALAGANLQSFTVNYSDDGLAAMLEGNPMIQMGRQMAQQQGEAGIAALPDDVKPLAQEILAFIADPQSLSIEVSAKGDLPLMEMGALGDPTQITQKLDISIDAN